jgi:8-oxo-dGTP pyrophosphatase MutT (NUDIX family)
MKTKKSAGLAIIYDNKILLAHTTSRGWYGSYGIPKGGIDDGESKLDAAIRETQEEVGINIPKKLIDPTEYTFTVSTKKYGHKIVYYYIVKIDDLSQIGLKDLRVPKKQLQIEEVDWAGFLDYKEAMKRVMKSQIPLVNNLVGKGLLEKNNIILKFKDFGTRL